jgi:multidrug efflux pump subunit AcrA (membrane-fusion protein)
LLATLDPTDQQNQLRAAQGDLAKVQAQLINAQANARRQQALFDRGVGAQAQLDIAQTDLKTTQASLDQARRRSARQGPARLHRAAHRPQSRGHRLECRSRPGGDRRPASGDPGATGHQGSGDRPAGHLADQIPADVVFLVAGQLDPSINTTATMREIEPQAKAPRAPAARG